MAEGTIDKLTIEVEGISSDAARKLDEIAASLNNLKTASSGLKLTSAANGVAKLASALSSMPSDAVSRLSGLANVLRPLANIGGINIGQLGKLPAVVREFSSLNVTSFTAQMRQLESSLGPLSASVERLANAYSRMPSSMRAAGVAARSVKSANENLSRVTERLASSTARSGSGLRTWMSGMRGAFTGLVATGHVLKNTVGSVINNVNTYIENMNLFQASMGDAAKSATDFGMKVQEVMGIDFGQWARNQGVFQTLATGMGVTADKASVMSQQLTQLGYDISSFYNLPVEEAMLKLQSGLAGELEPLRRIGWDLSNARMNLELAQMGIEGNAQSMTQAEKVAMRYKMIMEQVTIVHGDMARTLNSPANQIRILQAQLQLAARAVGNLFIPMLNKILPYAIGAAKAVRILAQEIANFLHLDINFEVDYSTLDTSGIATVSDDADEAIGAVEDTADAFDDAGDAAEAAQKKVKAYQNTVMGFDELNKLNAQQEDTSGLSGGSGTPKTPSLGDVGSPGLGLGDMDLPTYDFLEGLDNEVSRLSDEIANKMVTALKKILPWAVGIGAAIGAWKIGSAIYRNLGKLRDLLDNASTSAHNLSKKLEKAGNHRLSKVTDGMAGKLDKLNAKISPFVGAPVKFAAATIPWAGALLVVGAHFWNLWENSERFRDGLDKIKTVLEGLPDVSEIISGAWENVKRLVGEAWDKVKEFAKSLGIDVSPLTAAFGTIGEGLEAVGTILGEIGGAVTDVFDLKWSDALMVASGAILLFTGNPLGALVLGLEAASLAVRFFDWATEPCVESVDALGGASEDAAARFGTSLESMKGASQEIMDMEFGDKIITEEDVLNMRMRVQDIHDTIVNNLDARRNEELAAIDALAGVLPQEEIDRIKQGVIEVTEQMKADVDEGTAAIMSIYQRHAMDHTEVTEQERAEIERILDEQMKQLMETSGAGAEDLKKIEDAYNENKKAAAAEAASEVLKKAREAADGQIADANRTADDQISAAEKAKQAGTITQEQYDKVKEIANNTRDAQIAAAEEAYQGVCDKTKEKLGEWSDTVDYETGEVRDSFSFSVDAMRRDWDEFASTLENGIHANVGVNYQFSGWGDGQSVLMARQYDVGGFPVSGELFFARENGEPELVGSMGHKTSVANNAQIIEGIEAGVTNAMLSVLPAFSQSNDTGDVSLVLQVGSEELARAVSRGQASAARRGQIKADMMIA